jgi:hypothetical protein
LFARRSRLFTLSNGCDAKRLRGVEIDGELEFGRLLHGVDYPDSNKIAVARA